MTSNTKKIRSLFLTALMVFSVFAGTVALSGSAAAQTAGNVDPGNFDSFPRQDVDGSSPPTVVYVGVNARRRPFESVYRGF